MNLQRSKKETFNRRVKRACENCKKAKRCCDDKRFVFIFLI